MSTPASHAQLRTMFNDAQDTLVSLRGRMASLQEQLRTTETHIIAAQGVVAAFQAALGEPYDPNTVPMNLGA